MDSCGGDGSLIPLNHSPHNSPTPPSPAARASRTGQSAARRGTVRPLDAFALSEGYPPFTKARIADRDRICALLEPVMRHKSAEDPEIWLKSRIAQLKRELARLQSQLQS